MVLHRRVDVVTVGAGWTAAILAWRLTGAGVRVVSLEQGPPRAAHPDFSHNHDQLQYTIRLAMMHNIARESWTWRPNPTAPSLPMRQLGAYHPGKGVGGAGIHWASESWRFSPMDMRYRSHHVERYGEEMLPEGNQIQDWPVTYEDLAPHYDQVEYDIGMSGQAGNLNGRIIDGGNPFEGPRTRDYPLPPLVTSIPGQMFMRATRELGYHPFPQPSAILSRAYRGLSGKERAGCLYCAHCVRFGCEVDAKASPLTDHLPIAEGTGLYEIRPYCYVLHVNLNAEGLATGVTYVDTRSNEVHEQPADVVIISGYTNTNVRLMMLSTGLRHENGLGNNRGMLGKNLTYQLVQTPVAGIFEGRRFNLFTGNSVISAALHDLNGDNFDHTGLGFIGGASITCGGGERDPLTSVTGMPEIDADDSNGNGNDEEEDDNDNSDEREYPLIYGVVGSLAGQGEEWGEDWKENLRANWDSVVGIGMQGESLPYEDQFYDLDPHYNDIYGRPLLRLTFDWHENDDRLYAYIAQRCREMMESMEPTRMVFTPTLDPFSIYRYQSTHITGGAIMGTSPENSVTNRYGQVWDCPNVFVTGAALYPQNPGMNPTEPLLALAYYTGDHMVRRYLRNPERLLD